MSTNSGPELREQLFLDVLRASIRFQKATKEISPRPRGSRKEMPYEEKHREARHEGR